MIGIGVQFTGDWVTLQQKLLNSAYLEGILQIVRKRSLERIAKEYVRRVQLAIEAGEALRYGPALSPGWIAQKGHARPWEDFGDIKESITDFPLPDGQHFAGVPNTARGRRGQQLDLIALILEAGSLTVPARPIFEPVGEQLAEDKDFLSQVVEEELGAFF